MRSAFAFTLAELLIGVTVSAIVMVGVTVFVGSGIENAFKIQKGVSENRGSHEFDSALEALVAFGGKLSYSGTFSAPYGTGITLFSSQSPIPLSTISMKSVTGVCDAYSETSDHPGMGTALVVMESYRTNAAPSSGGLFADTLGHVVRNGGGTVVIGTGTPGNAGGEGSAPLVTELRSPSAVTEVSAGNFVVADSGNDRVLVYDGSSVRTLLDSSSGIRNPYDFATDGQTLAVLQNGPPFLIFGNSDGNGSSFSGSFVTPSALSFDSVRITLGGGRVPPANFSAYSFDFLPSTGTASVMGNTATVSFSGTSYGYSAGASGFLRINGIPVSASPNGWHSATVEYFDGASLRYRRDFPYFFVGDGNPLTPTDNGHALQGTERILAENPSISGTGVTYSSPNFPALVNSAPLVRTRTSPRLVENVEMHSDGTTVTLRYWEFLRYDCLFDQHVKRERIWKIPLE